MSKKRKECLVRERPVLDLITFDINDPATYDGTETLRGLTKFTKPYFSENQVAIKSVSKTFRGKTFVVPYVDRDGVRYWLRRKQKMTEKAISLIIEEMTVADYFKGYWGECLDILSNDEPEDGPGSAHIYPSGVLDPENGLGEIYNALLYCGRIEKIDGTNDEIMDELGAGKAYHQDSSDPAMITAEMLWHFHHDTPENLDDLLKYPVYAVKDLRSGIELLAELKAPFIFVVTGEKDQEADPLIDVLDEDEQDEEIDIEDELAVATHEYVIDEFSVLFKGEYYKCEKLFEISSSCTDYKVSLNGKPIDDDDIVTAVTEAVEDLAA